MMGPRGDSPGERQSWMRGSQEGTLRSCPPTGQAEGAERTRERLGSPGGLGPR